IESDEIRSAFSNGRICERTCHYDFNGTVSAFCWRNMGYVCSRWLNVGYYLSFSAYNKSCSVDSRSNHCSNGYCYLWKSGSWNGGGYGNVDTTVTRIFNSVHSI